MKILCTLLLLTAIAGVFSTCTDKSGFFDADGDPCAYYQENPAACSYAANNRQGVSARQACCACGGGKGSSIYTTTLSAGCKDRAGFFDADGDSCDAYISDPDLCHTAEPNRQGVSPRQACCACGGGSQAYMTELAGQCKDRAGFFDADGDPCDYYKGNPSACETSGKNRQGISPKSACCACGGGTKAFMTELAGQCKDKPGFFDADGDSCDVYMSDPDLCPIAEPNRQGVSPRQACCACGGGSQAYMTELAGQCKDRGGFFDADGDPCDYYKGNPNACATSGKNRQGISPKDACCACGGGSKAFMTELAAQCKDKPGFFDADGDSCDYYKGNPSACTTSGKNKQGISPKDACCACRAGQAFMTELAGQCKDKPGFFDADGDSCDAYMSDPDLCHTAEPNRQGVSPRQACCACGGGQN